MSKYIPSDGIMDGGEPYTEDELRIINNEIFDHEQDQHLSEDEGPIVHCPECLSDHLGYRNFDDMWCCIDCGNEWQED